jgi:glycosyltransferase involved in cell wall biosynthesis
MAAGLPVLASNCTSVKRILDETNTGTTYIFDSPSDFADVVKRIFNERSIASTYSMNGINEVRNRFNWLQSSASLLKLYSDLG